MRSILFLTAIVLVACTGSNDSTTQTTGGSSGTNDTGDGVDATAGTDGSEGTDGTEGTDGSDGEPPPPPCQSESDCDPGELCDCLGQCVPGGDTDLPPCLEDKNCGSGYFCDTCASTCRKLKLLCEPCETSEECDEGGACIDFSSGGRYCLRECLGPPGCPKDGFSCTTVANIDSKQCVPLSGKCSKPSLCDSDSECEYGAICNDGKCQTGCPSDDVCPKGQVCAGFRCVPACSDVNPCPEGQTCEDEHCKKIGGCLEPAHCEEPETYCDLTEELCKPGCLQDFDCKSSGKICEGGKCVLKGCTGNFYCAFEQVCELASGACIAAEGPHCETGCDPQDESACGGKPNWCLGLQDKDGNEKGQFCFVACGPDPSNACPQGYQCQPLEDQDGAVQGKICYRDCTVPPL